MIEIGRGRNESEASVFEKICWGNLAENIISANRKVKLKIGYCPYSRVSVLFWFSGVSLKVGINMTRPQNDLTITLKPLKVSKVQPMATTMVGSSDTSEVAGSETSGLNKISW